MDDPGPLGPSTAKKASTSRGRLAVAARWEAMKSRNSPSSLSVQKPDLSTAKAIEHSIQTRSARPVTRASRRPLELRGPGRLLARVNEDEHLFLARLVEHLFVADLVHCLVALDCLLLRDADELLLEEVRCGKGDLCSRLRPETSPRPGISAASPTGPRGAWYTVR